MDSGTFERLLYEEEGTSLDCKRDQYIFEDATKEKKAELLKDILAFANAWRREDAYILIGVDEVKGGKSIVKGVTEHLDDAKLQQFVNSKTQRPITFSYQPFVHDGKDVGIIKIAVQSRPFTLVKDFGGLQKETVYIRRSSSTAVAQFDEILEMRQAPQPPQTIVDVSFVHPVSLKLLGKDLRVESQAILYDSSQLPDNGERGTFSHFSVGTYANEDYYRQLADYLDKSSYFRPVKLSVSNLGGGLLSNVRAKINVHGSSDFDLLEEQDFPDMPVQRKSIIFQKYADVSNIRTTPKWISISRETGDWEIEARFGNIQPKDRSCTDEIFYIGGRVENRVNLAVRVFSDNVADPPAFNLVINIEGKERQLDYNELEIGT